MNTPSYNALVSKDRLIKTVIELCEEVNKGEGGGGGGTEDFIYDLDISALTSFEDSPLVIQDSDFYPAINDAYNAGKHVYVRLVHQDVQFMEISGVILNLYLVQEQGGTVIYSFNATAYSTTLLRGLLGFFVVASGLQNMFLIERKTF